MSSSSTVTWFKVSLSGIWSKEPWFAELWSAITALVWVGLAINSDEALSQWPSMTILSQLGNDTFWHQLTGTLAGMQLVCVLINERRARWVCAVLMCCFYGIVSVGWWGGAAGAPSVAFVFGWFGINLYSIGRLLRDVR